APLPLPERPVRATVPLESGGPDDAMRLVLERGRAADVAIVRPGGSSGDGFLAVALRASVSPPIATTIWRGSVPSDRELATISVVMLDDVAIGDGDAERLLRWVERGGGLVLGLGPNAGSLPASLASAAGLSRGSLIERATATVALVDGSHPAFQGTRAAGATALPGASLWRYHRLTPPGGADIIIR